MDELEEMTSAGISGFAPVKTKNMICMVDTGAMEDLMELDGEDNRIFESIDNFCFDFDD